MVNPDIAPYLPDPLIRVNPLFMNGAGEPEIGPVGENSFLNELLSPRLHHFCTPKDFVKLIIQQASNLHSVLNFHAIVRIEP